MTMPFRVTLCLGLCSIACSDGGSSRAATSSPAGSSAATAASAGTHASAPPAGASDAAALALPPLQPGFKRFIAPPIEVPAGMSNDWMQWVGGPTEQDYDVVSIQGAQNRIGHHALMLTTTQANAVGYTRLWTEQDQLSSSSLGGIGAEGAIPLPEGVVIRLRKGTYFAIQTHYLNASEKPVMGETYIDLKLSEPEPANKLASHFASTSLALSLPPKRQSTVDIHCKVGADLPILRMTNHMHHYGVSTFTELIDAFGRAQMLKRDDTWSEHWALAPNFDYFDVAKPLLIPAGSTLHTQCTWNNTSDQAVTFPTEMCVFATLILGATDFSCIEGQFRASEMEGASPPGGAAGAAAAGSGSAPAGAGACTGASDNAALTAEDFGTKRKTCATSCLGGSETCAAECLQRDAMLSPACAVCNAAQLTCAMQHCIGSCAAGFMSAGCTSCIETSCGAAYHACSGL